MSDKLADYRRKRDFERTGEPKGSRNEAPDRRPRPRYVMHLHAARQTHYDLRLEHEGVLRSWALPKGPSLAAGEKRLAVEVEPHPLEYGDFEGVIPEGEYGAGPSMLWDRGHWQPRSAPEPDKLDFDLVGEKLVGRWTLVRTGAGREAKANSWLLIKRSDGHGEVLRPDARSVVSGRTLDQIRSDGERRRSAAAGGLRNALPDPADLPDARRARAAEPVSPQLATLVNTPPAGDDWLHEVKLDGYRLIARCRGSDVRLYTRNRKNWTERFPELVSLLETLPAPATFDGELVAFDDNGVTDFGRLQDALASRPARTASLVYHVFDLLHLSGYDLAAVPLVDRKRLLAELLAAAELPDDAPLRYSDHIVGEGESVYEESCRMGLEGIISKEAGSRYSSGRQRSWQKSKCTHHEEFVVGGFTEPSGARSGFGSLLLGAFEADKLVYCGRVGSGFGQRELARLHRKLLRLERKTSPFDRVVPNAKGVHWVRPSTVIEVEYTQRTAAGALRHPVYRGTRPDRDAAEITRGTRTDPGVSALDDEPTVADTREDGKRRVAGIAISSPGKIMYDRQGVTKLDLALYYEAIHEWILPYLAYRPLMMLRCPDGRHQECFYQKHPTRGLLKGLATVAIAEKKSTAEHAYVRSLGDLVELVQAGVLELHPWGCSVEDVEHPDRITFDLDPGPGVSWRSVVEAARLVRDRVESLGLKAYVQTTGSKGLHVVVPLEPAAGWDEAKAFARTLARELAAAHPSGLTANMAKTRRKGRIFIDYLRNGRGNTAIASYSPRAREGAPVATPVRWRELGTGLRPDKYDLRSVRRRLGALKHDPWEGFHDDRVALDPARIARLEGG